MISGKRTYSGVFATRPTCQTEAATVVPFPVVRQALDSILPRDSVKRFLRRYAITYAS